MVRRFFPVLLFIVPLFLSHRACYAVVAGNVDYTNMQPDADLIELSQKIESSKQKWGISNYKLSDYTCRSMGLSEDACIGNSVCAQSGQLQGLGVSKWGKSQKAILMFIARNVAEHGAEFCVTQIQSARNSLADQPWVRFFLPSGNKEACFWACDDGYGGEGCLEPDTPFIENQDIVKLANDSKVAVSSTKMMKLSGYSYIDTFVLDENKYFCAHKTQFHTRHYVLLGAVNFTKDGNGVITQPIVVWTGLEQQVTTKTRVEASAFGTQRTLCKSGYHPVGDTCVMNDAAKEAGNGAQNVLCDGWPSLSLASYKKYYTSGMNCYEFRCSDGGQGFKSSTDFACVSCPTTSTSGVNRKGVCLSCAKGQVFDSKQKACRNPVQYSTQDLLYGKGKTSDSAKLSDQCWTKTSPEEYKKCVLGSSLQISGTIQKVENVSIGTAVSPFNDSIKDTGVISINGPVTTGGSYTTVSPSTSYTVTPGLINTGVIK